MTRLYTPAEVADILKISRGKVYDLIKNNELRGYHIGRHVIRIYEDDLDDYMAKTEAINENMQELHAHDA